MLSSPLVLQIPPSMQMTDEQFYDFCQVNRDLRIERNKLGEISIMSPTGSESGNREVGILGQLGLPEECLDNPNTISGDPVLPGFVLNISKVW
ncbi:Uma2 family endonuclease [Nostoc sp. 106C]|uniref:Uma2 family endonuclease n=1 Tax=Nostoc sp. 106C TaxID=1932667 RepID=UPI000A3C38EA|nr:Uma2 family endonuclease [Nostoc sp. 106C]